MNATPIDTTALAELGVSDRPFRPQECADRARRAAAFVDTGALDRSGPGSYLLLWRDEHSEAWLNTWWESRDTGYHDHQGSCVGVHVIEGTAWQEGLPVGGPRRARRYGPGESFGFPGSGIHRMDHDSRRRHRPRLLAAPAGHRPLRDHRRRTPSHGGPRRRRLTREPPAARRPQRDLTDCAGREIRTGGPCGSHIRPVTDERCPGPRALPSWEVRSPEGRPDIPV